MKLCLVLLGLVLMGGGLPESAQANSFSTDLSSPFGLQTADVLPPGVRNPRFSFIFSSVDSEFNGQGDIKALGARLTKNLTWNDVIKSQKTPVEKNLVKGLLKDAGIPDGTGPGATTGDVRSSTQTDAIALAFGVNDRLTVGIGVPIMQVAVNVDTGFVASEAGRQFVSKAISNNPPRGREAVDKLNNAIQQKVMDDGYNPIKNQSFTKMGDIRLIGKYNVFKDDYRTASAMMIISLPTGVAPNADNALDVPTGAGQYTVGAMALYDQILFPQLKWNVFAGNRFFIPRSMEKRIPDESGNAVSADKENVSMGAENQLMGGTSFKYQFPSVGLGFGAGYVYQYQNQVSYSGTKYDPIRYQWLSDLIPAEQMHSMLLQAEFSTIDWYKAKKFFYPMQAALTYTHALAGKNITYGDVVTADLVLFF